MKRQEQLGVSYTGAKDLAQGLAERTFASSDRTQQERVLVQTDSHVLPDAVHCIVVKSLAAIGVLIKIAATIRSTRICRR